LLKSKACIDAPLIDGDDEDDDAEGA